MELCHVARKKQFLPGVTCQNLVQHLRLVPPSTHLTCNDGRHAAMLVHILGQLAQAPAGYTADQHLPGQGFSTWAPLSMCSTTRRGGSHAETPRAPHASCCQPDCLRWAHLVGQKVRFFQGHAHPVSQLQLPCLLSSPSTDNDRVAWMALRCPRRRYPNMRTG